MRGFEFPDYPHASPAFLLRLAQLPLRLFLLFRCNLDHGCTVEVRPAFIQGCGTSCKSAGPDAGE